MPPPPLWFSTTTGWPSALAMPLADRARDEIDAAAGLHRCDDLDGLVGIGALTACDASQRRKRECCDPTRMPVQSVHCVHSVLRLGHVDPRVVAFCADHRIGRILDCQLSTVQCGQP